KALGLAHAEKGVRPLFDDHVDQKGVVPLFRTSTITAATVPSSATAGRRIPNSKFQILNCAVRPSVRHRVEQRVDAERVARAGEQIEVLAALALALERVAEVRVVRHDDQKVA